MSFEILLPYTAALLSYGLALGAFYKRPRTLVVWAFSLGMLLLALRETCIGLSLQVTSRLTALYWQQVSWLLTTILPSGWLLFSLTFARSNYQGFLRKWHWAVSTTLAVPLVVMAVFWRYIFQVPSHVAYTWQPVLRLGRVGSALCIIHLLLAVIILVNLEASLRGAGGTKRAQIKFMLLGVGTLFAVHIYTMNQAMLFATVTPIMHSVNSFAVLLAAALISVSLARHRLGSVQVSLSPTMLVSSLSILFVGLYLLIVGGLTRIVRASEQNQMLPLSAFFVFTALVVLAIVLLSDRLRQRFTYFLARHIYRARHDYRQVWLTFTERTTSVVEVKELCTVVTNLVSETLKVPAVSIWLWYDEAAKPVQLGGSTVFSDGQIPPAGLSKLVASIRHEQFPVDLSKVPDVQDIGMGLASSDDLHHTSLRYAVPLKAGKAFLGVMTLHERWIKEPLTVEDRNLLKVIADQTATSLRNFQLLQRLAQTQQLEAFQTLSAFFVHDLKNLASNLGMSLQNLPIHYDNPEFRDDLLHLIADSVAKIQGMCGRLSLLSQQLEIHCIETDLNDLVRIALERLQPSLSVPLLTDLRPLPRLSIDPQQIEKVLVNLVLNAQEALGPSGEIRVQTESLKDWVVLTVHDNGCGMSREFIERSLFQPFRTTKQKGLGIGMFQSKTIVEAHRGSIEVESEPGKGSTFQVLLRC